MMSQQYGNGNGNNNDNQAPLIGNATVRQTPFGTNETKVGISPDGMRTLIQAANGGWGNLIIFEAKKTGKLYVKLDTWKSNQQAQAQGQGQAQHGQKRQYGQQQAGYGNNNQRWQDQGNPTPPQQHRFDNPEYQPRQQAQQQPLPASPAQVARDLGQGMTAPTSHKSYTEDGEEIPF